MGERKGRWTFSHCHACALDDDSAHRDGPGVGCSADGPCEGCEAVWLWEPSRERTIDLAALGFRYRVSDEALLEIEEAERRALTCLQTANQYWFRGRPAP